MRSLSLRILLASLGTVLASLAAFLITFFSMVGPATERLIHHFQARQIEDAVDALKRGKARQRRLGSSHGSIVRSARRII